MILYHGSIVKVEAPQILPGEIGRDFGFAFYTTDIKEQAERWALRKARVADRRKAGNKAVVSIYEWQEDSALKIKRFPEPSLEWLDMVVKCRSDISFHHGYDVVIGKIADDNVGETVSYVIQGIMRKEDAAERLKFEKINNQIAFCTENALKELYFKGSYEIGVK